MDPASMLRETRLEADLSVRALGKRAGVSPSTIWRIEAGRMDPTVGMLTQLLESAGRGLDLVIADAAVPRLRALADAWEGSARGDRIDWTRLRAFLDHVALHPEEVAAAITPAPRPSGSALLDNLLAGIAETLADEQAIGSPVWTAQVPPLDVAWTTPGTPRSQEVARAATPAALAARGMTLAHTSLWREAGRSRGQIEMSEDFDQPIPDFESMIYGTDE